jgi:hypothetical protein
MIANSAAGADQHDTPRLLAFHYRAGYEQWTTLAGTVEAPALVYEVIETIEENGSPLYEGRIFDAATRELIHLMWTNCVLTSKSRLAYLYLASEMTWCRYSRSGE